MSTKVVIPASEKEEQFCPVCKKLAKQMCSSCKAVYYCTKDHQKSHWKSHSKSCRAFKLVEDSVLGRHYVATRKIQTGELLLREDEPLITVPNFIITKPVCLNCYAVLVFYNICTKLCKKCGWPLCLRCTKHGNECESTMKYLKSKVTINEINSQTINQLSHAVIVLRALGLRDTNPNAYQRFLNLDDGCLNTEKMEFIQNFSSSRSDGIFVKRLKKMGVIEETEIAKIIRIIMINGLATWTSRSQTAVFNKVSYFKHNCQANCSKSTTADGGVTIRAAVPISKGDAITISYTDTFWGVVKRRNILAATKLFDCICKRCSDPTEFGTMFNAIKCIKDECTGYMLPESFLMPKDKYRDFICLKCKASMPWLSVKEMLKWISINLDGVLYNDMQGCKQFIEDHTKLLHKNHFYIFFARVALVGSIAVCDELLDEKVTLCKELNVLTKILMPGEIRLRGVLLYHLYATLKMYSARQLPDLAAFARLMDEADRALAEATFLLRNEPITTKSSQLERVAQFLWQINVGATIV